MHDITARTEHRLRRFIAERLPGALYRRTAPVTITAWEVPDEPVTFAEAIGQRFTPFEVGSPWSKPWGTTWFHVEGSVPAEWAGEQDGRVELVLDLGYVPFQPGFQAEAAAWSTDGRLIKAIEPLNSYVPIDVAPGERFELYLEAAANPVVPSFDDGYLTELSWIKPTPMGDKATAGDQPIYTLRRLEVGLLDEPVWELAADIGTLQGLMLQLPASQPRRHEIVAAFGRMLDAVDPHDLAGSAAAGRAELAGVLASPAHASAHRVHAVGHAHIDSAWLWPLRETVRKCARTFSNVLRLMDEDEQVTFACSSAQQYAWIEEHYPELFERIKARVADGRFIPVGGMWVESDTNMPGGEALVRQFLEGTRYFANAFGVEPGEVWLPDSFGYSGAMPQIARAAGKESFLTQKISWNDTNTFPHHTFWWEGIDGTRIYTHFPPADTYNGLISGEELARAERQYAEKGRANTSLLPFGFGDGGGGPTREMLQAARRTADLEGSPRVLVSTPQAFFDAAKAEYPDPQVWTGEMYLEYHRGTYTSQHLTKAGNRRCEHLLREAELWAATAAVRVGAPYPAEQLRRLWREVLLLQFHDILPGSSIAWVHREAEQSYVRLMGELERLIETSVGALAGEGERALRFNAAPFAEAGVPALGAAAAAPVARVEPRRDGESWALENEHVRVRIDADGLVASLVDLAAERELVPAGQRLGLLQLHRDIPNEWDAWDINDFYRHNTTDLVAHEGISVEDGAVVVRRRTGSSEIETRFWLEEGSAVLGLGFAIDWHERQKLLKLTLPLDVHADRAASEIQFGHLYRPVVTNTSWDAARFETVAHRWVHVGEPGYGVAVTNSATYGYDIARSSDGDGRTWTTVRPSLLRAPLFPDPEADQGRHELEFGIVVGAQVGDAVVEGYRANLASREVGGQHDVAPLVSVEDGVLAVESVKLAADGSGDVIVRLYESLGNRTRARVRVDFAHRDVYATDLLERRIESTAVQVDDTGATLNARPFQIVTLRVAR